MASRWSRWRKKKKDEKHEEYDKMYRLYKNYSESEESDDQPAEDAADDAAEDAVEDTAGEAFDDVYVQQLSVSCSTPSIRDSDTIDEEDREEITVRGCGYKSNAPLKYRLAKFVVQYRLTVEATGALLSVLRDEGLDVPRTRTTLLETPRSAITPKRVHPGEYIHFGLKKTLTNLIDDPIVASMDDIVLDINIDGLPISKNGRCLWPILAAFPNVYTISPFVVGCYAGLKEPADFDEFLAD